MDKSDWNQVAWLAQQFAGAETTGEQFSAIGVAPDGPIVPKNTVNLEAVPDDWVDWSLVGVHNGEPVTKFVQRVNDEESTICFSYTDESSCVFGSLRRRLVNVVAAVPNWAFGNTEVHYVGHDHCRPYYWRRTWNQLKTATDDCTLMAYDQPLLTGKGIRAFFIDDAGRLICDEMVWIRDHLVNVVFAFDPASKERIELYSGLEQSSRSNSDRYSSIVPTKLGIVGVTNKKFGGIDIIEAGTCTAYHPLEAYDHIAFNVANHPDEKIMMITQYGDQVRQHYGYGKPGPAFTLPRRYQIGSIYKTFTQDEEKIQFIEVKRPHNKVGVVIGFTEGNAEQFLFPGAFDAITTPFEQGGNWYYYAQSGRFLLKLRIPSP